MAVLRDVTMSRSARTSHLQLPASRSQSAPKAGEKASWGTVCIAVHTSSRDYSMYSIVLEHMFAPPLTPWCTSHHVTTVWDTLRPYVGYLSVLHYRTPLNTGLHLSSLCYTFHPFTSLNTIT